MKVNKRTGMMISSVFWFNAILWWVIGAMLKPNPDSLLFQIILTFMYVGAIFGTGFVIISIFIPSELEERKYEVT